MEVGKVYLLRGGKILRYQGPYAGTGPALAFRQPSEGVSEPAVGYSAAQNDVLGLVTRSHLEAYIRDAKARGLDASEAEVALAEVPEA